MDDLHVQLRAAIEQRLATARALGRERWYAAYYSDMDEWRVRDRTTQEWRAEIFDDDRAETLATFIAANDPDWAIRRCEADLRLLDLLESWHHDPDCQIGRRELGGVCAHFEQRWRHECVAAVKALLASAYALDIPGSQT